LKKKISKKYIEYTEEYEIMHKVFKKAYGDNFDEDVHKFNFLHYGDDGTEFIFNHNFAKAFWGEDKIGNKINRKSIHRVEIPFYSWQYHLQQMVLEKNPIEYLKKFL